ncbi:hypothetical protein MLD38_013739 [Melastoma candidum]|uniref:Uncharacterized protein n=1 Tax=Melastoma candidum TaxID=119954 RepID=A0ACB9RAI4_9MYRT|nr:hypothetical protein MLD38_013739 [Melastoma candidum]
MGKSSKGRQKIQIAKLKNEANLLVTFSKRRAGLFKKASELATLCGVKFALIICSPTRKSFSFGNLNIDTIVDSYLNGEALPSVEDDPEAHWLEVQQCARLRELNHQLTQALDELEAARRHAKHVKMMLLAHQTDNWWEGPLPDLSLMQLRELSVALLELRKDTDQRPGITTVEVANLLPPEQQQQQVFQASSSTQPAVTFGLGNAAMTRFASNFTASQPQVPIMIPTPGYNFGEGTSRSH